MLISDLFAIVLLSAAILLQSLYFPVYTAHAVGETRDSAEENVAPGTTAINSVEITWGSMLFQYTDNGDGTGTWAPLAVGGDLITVTNLSGTDTLRATISYLPDSNTSGIQNVQANLVNIQAELPDSSAVTLYPHHNLAAQAVKLDMSPDTQTLPSNGYHTISARLELTGAPTESLVNASLGTITITISKPETEIYTWEHTHEAAENNPDKLYWVVQIIGCGNSSIPGSTVKAEILPRDPSPGSIMIDHLYAKDDKDAGITVMAGYEDPTGQTSGIWRQWTVTNESDGLTWVEAVTDQEGIVTSYGYWSYTMPEIIPGTDIPLGNRNWTYYINYSSTMVGTTQQGILGAMNLASITEKNGSVYHEVKGWIEVEHNEVHGNIVPFFRSFVLDNNKYYVKWDIAAIIPGLEVIGKDASNNPIYGKATYDWYIMDYLNVYDGYTRYGYIENDLGVPEKTTVTAKYLKDGKETSKDVPSLDAIISMDETTRDKYFCAWDVHWEAEYPENSSGSTVKYGKHIDILCRCYCTESTCHFWTTSGCGTKSDHDSNKEFCHCWTAPESVTLTFSYMTPYDPIYEQYKAAGTSGYRTLVNKAELWRSAETNGNMWSGIQVDILDVSIPIVQPNTTTYDVKKNDGTKYTVIHEFTGDVPAGLDASDYDAVYSVGDDVYLITPDTVPGYIFEGWTTTDTTIDQFHHFKMIGKDVTVVGVWTKRPDDDAGSDNSGGGT